MDIDHNEFLKHMFTDIGELFAEEVGPVAHILCEEVKEEWEGNLLKKGQRPGLRNMPVYVHKLSLLIEDPQNRKKFLDSVFSIEALSLFNKS
jgi:hypothetical protein